MEFDLADADRFLTALSGKEQSQFTFQTFDDLKERREPTLARVSHGTLREQSDSLTSLNKRGAGVFVTVNETDLKGRTEANIKSLRSLFVDDDHNSLPPLKISPSITVKTKRGIHAYWLLEENEPLILFRAAQSGLIEHLGTDPSIKDVCRVMRLPGFFHMKDPSNPFLIKTDILTSRRFRINEVIHVYPASSVRKVSRLDRPTIVPRSSMPSHAPLARKQDFWRNLIQSKATQGSRNSTITSLSGLMLRRVEPFVALELIQLWNQTHCDPPLPASEVSGIVDRIASKELTRRIRMGRKK